MSNSLTLNFFCTGCNGASEIKWFVNFLHFLILFICSMPSVFFLQFLRIYRVGLKGSYYMRADCQQTCCLWMMNYSWTSYQIQENSVLIAPLRNNGITAIGKPSTYSFSQTCCLLFEARRQRNKRTMQNRDSNIGIISHHSPLLYLSSTRQAWAQTAKPVRSTENQFLTMRISNWCSVWHTRPPREILYSRQRRQHKEMNGLLSCNLSQVCQHYFIFVK